MGKKSNANFQTAQFVKYVDSIFFYNRALFDETNEMRGNYPTLTSKLHVLLNVWAPC